MQTEFLSFSTRFWRGDLIVAIFTVEEYEKNIFPQYNKKQQQYLSSIVLRHGVSNQVMNNKIFVLLTSIVLVMMWRSVISVPS